MKKQNWLQSAAKNAVGIFERLGSDDTARFFADENKNSRRHTSSAKEEYREYGEELYSGFCGTSGESGKRGFGKNIRWLLYDKDGEITLVFTGRGEISGLQKQWNQSLVDIGAATYQIVVMPGITDISEVCAGDEIPVKLTRITIPDTVVNLGTWTFRQCRNLKSLELPDSVISIGKGAFSECESLESLRLPEGLTEIDDHAFEGCSALKEIVLPTTLESIGDNAFSGCSALTKIRIPNGVQKVGHGIFVGCSKDLIVYGYRRSPAERAAAECGLRFLPLVHADYRVYTPRHGWGFYVRDGENAASGRSGERINAFQLGLSGMSYNGGVVYRSCLHGKGWEKGSREDDFSGVLKGSAFPESIEITLYGTVAKYFDVCYNVCVPRYGWLGTASNGKRAGTSGFGWGIKDIRIWLVPKGEIPGESSPAFIQKIIENS